MMPPGAEAWFEADTAIALSEVGTNPMSITSRPTSRGRDGHQPSGSRRHQPAVAATGNAKRATAAGIIIDAAGHDPSAPARQEDVSGRRDCNTRRRVVTEVDGQSSSFVEDVSRHNCDGLRTAR